MTQRIVQLLKSPALLFMVGLVFAIALNFYKGGNPAKPFAWEVVPDAIATITEIRQRPVWVKFLNSRLETSASLNTAIAPGEMIKTENNALIEVKLKNGAVIRLEGNSILNFKLINQLNLIQLDLTQGKMLIKSAEGKGEKITIQTPKAIAEIVKGKAYFEVSVNLLLADQVFTLDGEVKIRSRFNRNLVTLRPNQLVRISALGQFPVQFPGQMEKPKLIAQVELEKRFPKNQLLFDLQPQIETLAKTQTQSVRNPGWEPKTTYEEPIYARSQEIPSPPNVSAIPSPPKDSSPPLPQRTEPKPESKAEPILAPAIQPDSEPSSLPVPVEVAPEPEANPQDP